MTTPGSLAIGMVVSAAVPVLGWLAGDAPARTDDNGEAAWAALVTAALAWTPVPVRPGRSEAARRAARARVAALRAHRAAVTLALAARP